MADRTYKSFKGFPIELRPGAAAQRTKRPSGDSAETQKLVDSISAWMDTAFEVPLLGWRFGWDALIGLLPGVGDAATTLVSIYIVGLAGKLGMPRVTIARMGLNVAIDMLLGSLPLVGDFFDVYWKANARNAALLRQRLAESPPDARRATGNDWLFVGLVMAGLVALFALIATVIGLSLAALWRVATG